MTEIDVQSLVGKTIAKTNTDSVNVTHLHFTDGTAVSVTYEYTGNNLNKIVFQPLWNEEKEE